VLVHLAPSAPSAWSIGCINATNGLLYNNVWQGARSTGPAPAEEDKMNEKPGSGADGENASQQPVAYVISGITGSRG